MDNVAFLPFRSGSKGTPHKNIRPFGESGLPLYYYVLNEVLKVKEFSQIILATDYNMDCSDFPKIEDTRVKWWDRRGMDNAGDNSSTEQVLMDWLTVIPSHSLPKRIVLIQVTNPFIKSQYLKTALRSYQGKGTLFSAVEFHGHVWKEISQQGVVLPVEEESFTRVRRQDSSKKVLENGAFYIINTSEFLLSGNRFNFPVSSFLMPKHTSFEIDEKEDFKIAEILLE